MTKKKSDADAMPIWRRYREHRRNKDLDALIRYYAYLAYHYANKLGETISMRVSLEEMEAAGLEGLMQAVRRWDPDGNTQFKTFASRRIFGAIIDWIRATNAHQYSRNGTFRPQHFPLDILCRQTGNDNDEGEFDTAVEDPQAEDPTVSIEREDYQEFLSRGLMPQERLILALYYYQGLEEWRIGATIGCSESRVSQLKTQIVDRLRYRFRNVNTLPSLS